MKNTLKAVFLQPLPRFVNQLSPGIDRCRWVSLGLGVSGVCCLVAAALIDWRLSVPTEKETAARGVTGLRKSA